MAKTVSKVLAPYKLHVYELAGFSTSRNMCMRVFNGQEVLVSMPAATLEQLSRSVEALVRERFPVATIHSVGVEEGFDHDGDPVLFVRIVFDGEPGDLPTNKMTGLVRHLRTTLEKIGEDRFPHTRYISRADFEGAAA